MYHTNFKYHLGLGRPDLSTPTPLLFGTMAMRASNESSSVSFPYKVAFHRPGLAPRLDVWAMITTIITTVEKQTQFGLSVFYGKKVLHVGAKCWLCTQVLHVLLAYPLSEGKWAEQTSAVKRTEFTPLATSGRTLLLILVTWIEINLSRGTWALMEIQALNALNWFSSSLKIMRLLGFKQWHWPHT